ncbi:MAG: hypothetical protein ACJ75B_07850 [Flavisolibacter sp.]
MEKKKKKKDLSADPQLQKEAGVNDPRAAADDTKKEDKEQTLWYGEDLDRDLGEQMGEGNEMLT